MQVKQNGNGYNIMRLSLALVVAALAAAQDFNYNVQGQDWTGDCSYGRWQSPINFREVPQEPKNMVYVTASNSSSIPLNFNYPDLSNYIAQQTSTAFQVTNVAGSLQAVRIGDTAPTNFALTRIVFHAPAEHLWNGARYPLEMQLEHASDSGAVAIVGVWFVRSPQRSALLDALINGQPAQLSEELGGLSQEYYFYMGSLTTPPCTEGVSWFIPRLGFRNALPASPDQIAFFSSMWADNSDFAGGFGNDRLDQLIYDRYVYHFIPSPESQSFLQ